MNRIDKFGRRLTQVNVNWDTYWVPEYKVGDLVTIRPTRWLKHDGVGTIREISVRSELNVEFTDFDMTGWYQDYEIELVSPVDN